MLTALDDAMPGPLEASFDVQVAEYLKRLFGARATERRAAIRFAQEHERSSTRGVVVVDQRRHAARDRGRSALRFVATGGPSSSTLTSTSTLRAACAANVAAQAVLAVAALLALVALGGGIRQLAARHVPARGARLARALFRPNRLSPSSAPAPASCG